MLLRFPVLPLRLFFRPSLLLDAMTSSMFRRRASLARQRRPPSHRLMVKRATMSGSRRYLGKPRKRCLETSNQLHPRGPSTISIRKARTSVVSFSLKVSSFRTVTKVFITGSGCMHGKNIYLSVCEATPFTAIQPKVEAGPEVGPGSPLAVKQAGVTKIGNNTYFYSGPKGEKVGSKEDSKLQNIRNRILGIRSHYYDGLKFACIDFSSQQ